MYDPGTPAQIHSTSRSQPSSNYDRLSRWYDLLSGPFEARWRNLALSRLDLTAGQPILEIGCGTGHALIHLAEATGMLCGLDASVGMCRVARTRVARCRLDQVSVMQGDARSLPFQSGCFAATFMSFTLELFSGEDTTAVLAECRRVLGAAGRLGVAALDRPDGGNAVTRLYDRASRRFPNWIDCRPIPVEETLSEHGFRPTEAVRGSMAGLPVAIVIAVKIGG